MRTVKAGELVKITDGSHYQLPPDLAHGDIVKLISFDHGFWKVKKDGRQFTVFLCRIAPGWEYEIGGRWLPETDWRVKALREMHSR